MNLSPFVHTYQITPEVVCLFNSINLKKVYLSKNKYNDLIKDIKEDKKTELVKRLIDIKMIVEKDINKEKIFERLQEYLKIDIITSYIFLTDECNLNCKYCFEEKPKEYHNITKEDADEIAEIISRNASKRTYKEGGERPYQIFFYGGEPLLKSEVMFYLTEKLEAIDKINFAFAINTNGTLVTKNIAKKLKKHNFSVCVSLDGWEDINNCARIYRNGEGTFKDILRGIFILKDQGITPSISCTLSTHNYYLTPKIIEFFSYLGIKQVGFNILMGNQEDQKVSPKILAYYLFEGFKKASELNMTEDRIGERRYLFLLSEIPRTTDCVGCGQQICFFPNKEIGVCEAFYQNKKFSIRRTKSFNVNEHPLWKEWSKRSPFYIKCNCPAVSICGGGCPYNSYLTYGSIWEKDKYFCEIMRETVKNLLTYYYYEKVASVNIKKIDYYDLKSFIFLLKEIKKEDPSFYGKDEEEFGIKAVEMNYTQKGIFLIAKEKDKVIGFCNLFGKNGRAEIGIGVHPNYRNKGIGKQLLDKILKKAKEKGLRKVYAGVKKTNINSLNFFKKNGFIVNKVREDSILLERII